MEKDSLRGSSVNIGAIQGILAWPLRQDDMHKSSSVNNCLLFICYVLVISYCHYYHHYHYHHYYYYYWYYDHYHYHYYYHSRAGRHGHGHGRHGRLHGHARP